MPDLRVFLLKSGTAMFGELKHDQVPSPIDLCSHFLGTSAELLGELWLYRQYAAKARFEYVEVCRPDE